MANKKINVEHYDVTYKKIQGQAYYGSDHENMFDFTFYNYDLREYLTEQRLIGEVELDVVDNDFDHTTVLHNVTLTEFIEESLDQFVIEDFLEWREKQNKAVLRAV